MSKLISVPYHQNKHLTHLSLEVHLGHTLSESGINEAKHFLTAEATGCSGRSLENDVTVSGWREAGGTRRATKRDCV